MSVIPLAQLASWIHNELDKDLEKNLKAAQKLVKDVLAIVKDMDRKVRKLEDYANSELSKGSQQLVRTTRTRTEYKVARHLANFSETFLNLLSSLNIPDPQNPTPTTLREFHDASVLFARDVKTLFSKFRTILYAPWVRKEAKDLQKFFVEFVRKRGEFKQFNDTDFSLNREVEVFLHRLVQLQTRHQALMESTQELHTIQTEEQAAQVRKQELDHQLKTLQTDPSFHEWEQIHRKQYALEQKLQKLVNPLKRALRKVENQVDKVQDLFTPRAITHIGDYFEDPYNTFVADEDSPNILVEIARGIKASIESDKLVIDKSRGRKSLAAAERLIQNPSRLYSLMETHADIKTEIEHFRSSSTTKTLFNELTSLEEQSKEITLILRELNRRKKRINATVANDKQIFDEQKNELEMMARALTGKSLKIDDS